MDLREGLVLPRADGPPLTVARARDHGGRQVLAFVEITDRDGAEAARGDVLYAPRELVHLDDGDVWVADLLGREVVDADGTLVGVVEAVRDGHAHDYLVIARTDGSEVMIPVVDELVDLNADPLVVRPVTGLLDPDEAW